MRVRKRASKSVGVRERVRVLRQKSKLTKDDREMKRSEN